jgi:phosphatidylglycerophosphate synthase
VYPRADVDSRAGAFLDEAGAKGEEDLMAFNAGSTYGSAKRWPTERYAALADRLIESLGVWILLTGAASDGEVARAKGMSTRWGGWFDVTVDALIQMMLPLAIAIGMTKVIGWGWPLLLGGPAALGVALDFWITLRAKARGFGPAIPGDPGRARQEFAGRGGLSGTGLPVLQWFRANATHENFSWVVVAALVFQGQLALLALMAVGCHLFWIQYLRKERLRLQ